MTEAEKKEFAELQKRKAWRSPRYLELARKAHSEASDRWRQEDVWGHTFTGS